MTYDEACAVLAAARALSPTGVYDVWHGREEVRKAIKEPVCGNPTCRIFLMVDGRWVTCCSDSTCMSLTCTRDGEAEYWRWL